MSVDATPFEVPTWLQRNTPGSDGYHRRFLAMALNQARLSLDPATKVGAVIVAGDRLVAAGFNDFPRGVIATTERLTDRDLKLALIVHGEMNAVLAAARAGVALQGATLYLAATDDSGAVWGGPPCTRCSAEIIQAGIAEIVSWPFKASPSKWRVDIERARALLIETGVRYRELPLSSPL